MFGVRMMSENVVLVICLTILAILFGGEPDIADSIIVALAL